MPHRWSSSVSEHGHAHAKSTAQNSERSAQHSHAPPPPLILQTIDSHAECNLLVLSLTTSHRRSPPHGCRSAAASSPQRVAGSCLPPNQIIEIWPPWSWLHEGIVLQKLVGVPISGASPRGGLWSSPLATQLPADLAHRDTGKPSRGVSVGHPCSCAPLGRHYDTMTIHHVSFSIHNMLTLCLYIHPPIC